MFLRALSVQEAARSRYNDVLDFDSSSAILKIEWREEDLGFTAHVQPFLSPVTYTTNEKGIETKRKGVVICLAKFTTKDWGRQIHGSISKSQRIAL